MRPTGGVNLNAVVTGLTYANGPIVVGAEIGLINGQGDARLVGISQRRETEVAFGGSYRFAPGVQAIAEYMYEYRHQGDYNFASGAVGAGTGDARANSFLVGTVLTW
jgi:predicted porin